MYDGTVLINSGVLDSIPERFLVFGAQYLIKHVLINGRYEVQKNPVVFACSSSY